MLFSISSSSLLTQARHKLLQNPASLPPAEDKSTAASAVPVATAAKANVDTTSVKNDDAGTSATQQKTIVDQRTTDTGSMRITAISYSDGSSDTLQQVKKIDQSTPTASAKLFSLSDKNLMIDRTV